MNDSDARYRGDVVNCTRHGNGTYVYPDGGQGSMSYKGQWENNVKGPTGTFSVKGLFQYKGEFKDGEMTGKGIRKWEDGRSYEGDWLNGEMHGKGKWINTSTNEIYDGNFVNNQRDGYGTLQRGAESYKGHFQNHKYQGNGTLLFSNNCIVKGNFEQNIINGKTDVQWGKSAVYIGDVVNGAMHNYGYFRANNGTYEYDGDWIDGLPNKESSGSYIWAKLQEPATDAKAAGKGKKKADKKRPAKGKGSTTDISLDPIATLQTGDALPKIDVKIQSGNPPPIGEELPEPEKFAVLKELYRKVKLEIRSARIITPTEDNGDDAKLPYIEYSDPQKFWLRNPSLEQESGEKSRFSPHCLVFMSELKSEEEELLTWKGIVEATGKYTIDNLGLKFFNTDGSSVDVSETRDLLVSPSMSLSYYPISSNNYGKVDIDSSHAICNNSDAVTFISDFALDGFSCLNINKTSLALERSNSLSSFASSRSNSLDSSKLDNVEISLLHLTRGLVDSEDFYELELVLIVPGENMNTSKALYEMKLQREKNLNINNAEGENPSKEDYITPKYITDESLKWTGCKIELRSTKTKSICGRWSLNNEFYAEYWHSCALTLRNSSPSSASPGIELFVDGNSIRPDDSAGCLLSSDFLEDSLVSKNTPIGIYIGKNNFEGKLKTLAICSAQDRVNCIEATNCYKNWLFFEVQGKEEKVCPEDEETSIIIPTGYKEVNEAEILLVYGTGSLEEGTIMIPESFEIATSDDGSPLSYILSVSDNVDQICSIDRKEEDVIPEAEAPAEEEEGEEIVKQIEIKPRPPSEMVHMSHVARKLGSFNDLVVNISAPAE